MGLRAKVRRVFRKLSGRKSTPPPTPLNAPSTRTNKSTQKQPAKPTSALNPPIVHTPPPVISRPVSPTQISPGRAPNASPRPSSLPVPRPSIGTRDISSPTQNANHHSSERPTSEGSGHVPTAKLIVHGEVPVYTHEASEEAARRADSIESRQRSLIQEHMKKEGDEDSPPSSYESVKSLRLVSDDLQRTGTIMDRAEEERKTSAEKARRKMSRTGSESDYDRHCKFPGSKSLGMR